MSRRRARLASWGFAAVAAAALVGCGGDDGDEVTADGAAATTATTAQTTTSSEAPGETTTTGDDAAGSPSTEPPDDAEPATTSPPEDPADVTPPLDATPELEGVGPASSLQQLAEEIVAELRGMYVQPEGPTTISSTSESSGGTGTVAVRVDGLPDDSIAGWRYEVDAAEDAGDWTVVAASKAAVCRRGISDGLCL